jgi:hypothetical protein
VLELEQLVPVHERGGVGWGAVVGAAPRHEVQLPRLAGATGLGEVVDQGGDGFARQRVPEELGLGEQVRLRFGLTLLGLVLGGAELRPEGPRLGEG